MLFVELLSTIFARTFASAQVFFWFYEVSRNVPESLSLTTAVLAVLGVV